jgi:aromatic ring-opening dioxygenase catalytic subunit (LigB family)
MQSQAAEVLLPVLFLSHGAGPAWLIDGDSGSGSGFLAELGSKSESAVYLRNMRNAAALPRHPKAILVVSAHWEETEHTVMMSDKTSLYFDYYGFPEATYKIKWPVCGAPEVAKTVCRLLAEKGIKYKEDHKRGLDHGVFVPLKLAYPEADVPG